LRITTSQVLARTSCVNTLDRHRCGGSLRFFTRTLTVISSDSPLLSSSLIISSLSLSALSFFLLIRCSLISSVLSLRRLIRCSLISSVARIR